MSNDFFRRLLLFSPEVSNDMQTSGSLTLPTMSAILGANPNSITNPAEAGRVQDRLQTAKRYKFIDYNIPRTTMGRASPGGFNAPGFMSNMTMKRVGKGTGRFLTELAGAMGNIMYGPLAKPVLDRMFEWSGLTSYLSPGLSGAGPSPFMPEWLGGTADNPDYEYPIPNWSEENQFNMTAPENLRRLGPDGQPVTGMGSYRTGAGFVTGLLDPSRPMYSTGEYTRMRKKSELDKRAETLVR